MDRLDDAILRAFAEWRTPWLNRAAADVSSLGSMTVIILISVTAFTLLWIIAGDRVGAAKIVTAAAGAEMLVEVIKRLLQHPRPTIVPYLVEFSGFSYPSGHALVATATYGTLSVIACGYVRQRRGRIAIRSIAWTLAGLVAISRVYLGVHYPSDVLGGVLIGIACLYIVAYLWR
jgi:undecaprenyl-diphosphatase